MRYRLLPVLLFALFASELRAQTPITFNNQIVRIFEQHCQTCHRPGNIAPFSLLTYQDAVVRARLIADNVQLKLMPPWKPVNAHGIFKGERALTDDEIQTIVQWASNGAPEGAPADLPALAKFPDTWSTGPPNMIVRPSEPYQIPDGSADVYRCFPIVLDAQTDLNVRGYEVLPSNRAIVHHVLLFTDEFNQSAGLDDAEAGPGYTCFGGPGFLIGAGLLGGWVPGSSSDMFPLGTGVRIPKGTRIVMQVHYSLTDVHTGEATGLTNQFDQTRVGLYFSPTALQQLSYIPVVNPFFQIPAGDSHHLVTALSNVPRNLDLVAIAPHMHLLGRDIRVTARFPNGTTRELIHIDDWDFHWQGFYAFQQPVSLPAGTIVELDAYYDNSLNNPRNPSNPPVPVGWGERTIDEMCLTFLVVKTPGTPSINTVPFSLSDRSLTSAITREGSTNTSTGYAKVSSVSGPTPAGLAIFGYRQNGVVISEASVPSSGLLTRARLSAELNGAARTGIAIANPNSDPAAISFSFTDANGQTVSSGSGTVPANGQLAAFLDEAPFGGPSRFTGSFSITSSRGVSLVALRGYLNERSEMLLTTTAVANLDPTVAAGTLFPHFADGGGWSTQIALVNPTDNAITGTLRFLDSRGQPSSITLNGAAVIGDFDYSIPPRAAVQLLTGGAASAASAGSIRIIPSPNNAVPAGSVVFSYRNGGVRVTEAGLPASTPALAFRIYAEGSQSTQSGIAITNPSAAAVTVNVELINPGGSTIASGTVTVGPNSQAASFLSQIPGFDGVRLPFQGLLRVTSAAPVAVAGLRGRYNERGDFIITTTPPVPEQISLSANDMYFAHFADGGGFTTQFVIFSGAGFPAGGNLRFVSQAGQSMDLKLE
jgi:hypothetical protein